MNTLGPGADFLNSFGITRVLTTDAGERMKNPAKQKGSAPVAAKRFVGEPRVHEKDGNSQLRRAPKKIRPNLSLDQHDCFGADESQRMAHVATGVERVINF